MIIINVLPPEYRRRDIGVNPITLSIAAAVAVNVIVALLWVYVQFLCIPYAEGVREQRTNDKSMAQLEAKKVDDIEAEIAKQEGVKQALFNLLNKKVYWAQTLNDFVGVLGNPNNKLNTGEFRVSVDSLKISEVKAQTTGRRKKVGAEENTGRIFNYEWRVQVVSNDPMKSNANIRAFFEVFESDKFWFKHNFDGKPDVTYGGSAVKWEEDVERGVSVFNLKWRRQVISNNADEIIAKMEAEAEAAAGEAN